MGKRSIETLVGAFVLLGMLCLVFLAMKAANLGSVGGGNTYTLQARFDNVGGLKVRAPGGENFLKIKADLAILKKPGV